MAISTEHTSRLRTKSMTVLCLGLPRTGTTSLRQGLYDLGIADTYHYSYLMENMSDAEMWNEAFDLKFGKGNGDKPKGLDWSAEQWDRVLGSCMSVSDNPCITFAAELIRAYPDALVVLQTRDSADAWYKSYSETILPVDETFHAPTRNPLYMFRRLFLPDNAMVRFNDSLVRWSPVSSARFRREGRELYHKYNQSVRDMMVEHPDRILEYNVKQGWEPLCTFLGKDVPVDPDSGKVKPFPRLNDTNEFRKQIELWAKAENMNYQLPMSGILAVIGIVGAMAAAGAYALRSSWVQH